jgi:hypothetical protein
MVQSAFPSTVLHLAITPRVLHKFINNVDSTGLGSLILHFQKGDTLGLGGCSGMGKKKLIDIGFNKRLSLGLDWFFGYGHD